MGKLAKGRFILTIGLVLPIAMVAFAGAYAKPAQDLPKEVDLATLPVGAVAYVVASGFATTIAKHTPMKVSVKPMSGPTAWSPMVNSGELDMAYYSIPDLVTNYKAGQTKLRLLWHPYTITVVALAVRADSGIKRISQLKGKRVTAGFPAEAILEPEIEVALASAGLTWDDVVKVPMPDIVSGLKALREGRVDASFALGPTAPLTVETDKAISLYALPLDPGPKLDEALKRLLPGSKSKVMKAGTGIIKEDTLGYDLATGYVASTRLNEAAVYEIVKAVWENYEEIRPIHPWVRGFSPDKMVSKPTAVPYHQGAVRFYKEKGVWTKEFEAAQQALLKK